MRISTFIFSAVLAICPVAVCAQQHIPPPNLPGDSIVLLSAVTESGQPVKRGQPVPMIVTLGYTLASHDTAILSLSTAQFRGNSCSGPGELINAEERLVSMGTGQIVLHITWDGDTGTHSKGRIYGQGSLSFTAMFWQEQNGARIRNMRFGIFPFYSESCSVF